MLGADGRPGTPPGGFYKGQTAPEAGNLGHAAQTLRAAYETGTGKGLMKLTDSRNTNGDDLWSRTFNGYLNTR